MTAISALLNRVNQQSYIVLRYTGWDKWGVVSESADGVPHDTATMIVNYHVNVKNEHPQRFIIVEVPEVKK